MKNQGISLISLIITIIVIIILAAIVIFAGLGTPDSANFAKFCQDVDNVQSVVLNSFADLKANYATQNKTRTNEQLYMEVATGTPINQYTNMQVDKKSGDSGYVEGTSANFAKTAENACQNIISENAKLRYKLPDVRQSNSAWYVTADGQVFNATGYLYKVDGKTYTYFSANLRAGNGTDDFKMSAEKGETYPTRAGKIARALHDGVTTVSMQLTDK